MRTLTPNLSMYQWLSLMRRRDYEMTADRIWSVSEGTSWWTSRTTWSLVVLADLRSRVLGRPARVAVPRLFCESTLSALRRCNYEIIIYADSESSSSGSDNAWRLEQDLTINPPDVVVGVHYFGRFNPDLELLANWSADKDCWVVEDCAHVLVPVNRIGSFGDFVLYSPYKVLPLPFLALTVHRPNGPGRVSAESISGAVGGHDLKLFAFNVADRHKIDTTSAHLDSALWLVKRLAQRLGFFQNIRLGTEYLSNARKSSRLVNPQPSRLSMRIVNLLSRKDNYSVLHRLLGGRGNWSSVRSVEMRRFALHRILCSIVSAPNRRVQLLDPETDSAPYLFEVVDPKAESQVDVCKFGRVFEEAKIPVTEWPDVVSDLKSDDLVAVAAYKRRRVFLPIHQSLELRDLKELENAVTGAESFWLIRSCDDYSEWNELMSRHPRSNLLQSWEYGESRGAKSSWKPIRLIAESLCPDRSIAICQVLAKRFGPIRFFRVSRGPLLLSCCSHSNEKVLWRELQRHLGYGIFSVALEMSIEYEKPQLIPTGRLMRLPGWSSGWVKLNSDEREQLGSISPKWRNQLRKAHKSGVSVDCYWDGGSVSSFVRAYEDFRNERGFVSVSSELIEDFMGRLVPSNKGLIVKARVRDAQLAAAIFVLHGTCATYLASWTNEDGRRLNAMNAVIWQSLRELQRVGVSNVDLGGIDEDGTPGVAHFKLGLNPSRYRLIGETIAVSWHS